MGILTKYIILAVIFCPSMSWAAMNAVADLAASNAQWNTITLTWTPPTPATTRAKAYDVRYSTSEITSGNFAAATQGTLNVPAPIKGAIYGHNRTQSMDVVLPNVDTTYYFAIKSQDPDDDSWSEISNVVSLATTTGPTRTAIDSCQTLSSANTYYYLTQDVTATTGHCFPITASGVTLDLNGYTITYGYDYHLENPSFETNTTGWTFSTGDIARVATADEIPMAGNYGLKVTKPSGGWENLTITSDYINSVPSGVKMAAFMLVQRMYNLSTPRVYIKVDAERYNGGAPVVVDSWTYSSDTINPYGGIPSLSIDSEYQTIVPDNYRLKLTVLSKWTGTHTGSNDSAELVDSVGTFPSSLSGYRLRNVTNGSSCTITSNTLTTATCTLTGGTEQDWDSGDSYIVDMDARTHFYLDAVSMMAGSDSTDLGTDPGGYHGVYNIAGSSTKPNLTVKNGTIQAVAPMMSSFGVYTQSQANVTVRNVNISNADGVIGYSYSNGPGGVYINYGSGHSVSRSTVDVSGQFTDLHRASFDSAIMFGGGSSSALYNTVIGGATTGISFGDSGTTVSNNYIDVNTEITNHAGVIVYNGANASVENNDIIADPGQGIEIASSSTSVDVMYNDINILTLEPNYEYGFINMDGIRVNDYQEYDKKVSDIDIEYNVISLTGEHSERNILTYNYSSFRKNINGFAASTVGENVVFSNNTVNVDAVSQDIATTGISLGGGTSFDVGGTVVKWCESPSTPGVYMMTKSTSVCGSSYVDPYKYTASYQGRVSEVREMISNSDLVKMSKVLSAESVSPGKWYFGDADSLGFNTVYLALTGGASPATVAAANLVLVDANNPVVYENNTINYDGVALWVSSYSAAKTSLVSNLVLNKTGEAGDCHGYSGITAIPVSGGNCDISGTRTYSSFNVSLINTTETGSNGFTANQDNFQKGGMPVGFVELYPKWRLDLTITNDGTPQAGATVVIKDSDGATEATCTTDASGQCTDVVLTEYRKYGRTAGTIYTDSKTPHEITATYGAEAEVASITMDASKAYTVDLVTGGVDPVCDFNHPALCLTEGECEAVSGLYWCDGECQTTECSSPPVVSRRLFRNVRLHTEE